MKCVKCGRNNRSKAKFCDDCGVMLITPAKSGASVTAGAGGVAVGGKVNGGIRINSPSTILRSEGAVSPRALISAYLEAVVRECAPLRLKAIDQRAAGPGREPLGLTSVYIDLDLNWRIPAKSSLVSWLSKPRLASSTPDSSRAVSEGEGSRRVPVLEAIAAFPRFVLLGAPGSGKSTVSAYVALTLAEAGLGRKAVLKRLGGSWKHGALIPIRVVLRQFAAALPPGVRKGRAKHLWDFIKEELTSSGLAEPTGPALQSMVAKEGALFLLDGLDETKDSTTRSRLTEAVTEFMAQSSPKSRFFLTSRPYAWEEIAQVATDLASEPGEREGCANLLEALPERQHLADFSLGQTEQFIKSWYGAISALGWISDEDAREKEPELQIAVHRTDLRSLAVNPLLLTLMATLHSNRARLPDDRADLYNEVVELLLQRWNETVGADRGLLDTLAIPSLKLGDLRGALEQLAYEIHGAHTGKDGVADIPEGDLVAALKPLVAGSADKAALVVDYVEKRAGLLLGHGSRGKQRQFAFPHRTFQEFLAGCHLAGLRDYEHEVVRLAEENPSHWREVLKFAARRATAGRGVPASGVLVNHADVTQWLATSTATDRDWRKAMLAAEQLLEIGLAAVNSRSEHRAVRERVTEWLVRLIERNALPPVERVEAGNLLGRIGDPRPGVAPANLEELGGIEFCYVPPGTFLGNGKASLNLDHGFWISRFPITKGQFDIFIKSGGYTEKEYWSSAGSFWRGGKVEDSEIGRRNGPPVWATRSLLNHPVGGVSGYEAEAFCAWMTHCWKHKLPADWKIALPSFNEWQKSGRGGEWLPKTTTVVRLIDGLSTPELPLAEKNPEPRRTFPARGGFDPNKANVTKKSTSAVGCFVEGASPYGVLDMAGNVLEWVCDRLKNKGSLAGNSFATSNIENSLVNKFHISYSTTANNVGFRIVGRFSKKT